MVTRRKWFTIPRIVCSIGSCADQCDRPFDLRPATARMARLCRRSRQLAVRSRHAINRSNVSKLEVAWTYPAARPTSIRSSSATSCTAAAPTARSWRSRLRLESRSGSARDRRLQRAWDELLGEQGWQGPPADFQHRQHAPGARRANRARRPLVRQRGPGRSARRPGSRPGEGQSAVAHARSSLREPPDHGVRDESGVRTPRQETSAHSTFVPVRSSGHSIRSRGRANSATRRGRRMRGRPSGAPTTGENSR